MTQSFCLLGKSRSMSTTFEILVARSSSHEKTGLALGHGDFVAHKIPKSSAMGLAKENESHRHLKRDMKE